MADDRPDDRQPPMPAEQLARLYEEAEAQAAKAGERFVASRGFASLLGQMAENAAALTKIGTDVMDLWLRNLRVAGRRDVARLARQLGRTEDKLERVLQELEDLRDQVGEAEEPPASRRPTRRRSARPRSANGAVGDSPPAEPSGESAPVSPGADGDGEEPRTSS
jgi:hypothetical protein